MEQKGKKRFGKIFQKGGIMETSSNIEKVDHPGKYLNEILEEKNMTQKELSVRTGVSEKHISTIIKGTKNISASFARRLEYALPKPMSYWMLLQTEYDNYILQREEKEGISFEEQKVLSVLKDIVKFLQEKGMIENVTDKTDIILALRKFMGVSRLTAIPEIKYNAAYRAQVSNNVNVDPYILYAWKRICERYVSDINISGNVNNDELRKRISDIKNLMFLGINQIETELTRILADCGIAFKIVPHFRGAPVQGFISKNSNDKMMLCLTLRQGRADKFWFTLFHEIGHILNGDGDLNFVDFDSVKSEAEEQADLFAKNALLDSNAYRKFWAKGDFSLPVIKKFAEEQHVKPYIVIGRLQKENELEWSEYSKEMVYYKWASSEM